MTNSTLLHPVSHETVEQCARRFLRCASQPGYGTDKDLARNTAFKLMLKSDDEIERLFYVAVHAWLSEG